MGERVKCPFCGEWVTLPRRPAALWDPAAARHMKRCPFNPLLAKYDRRPTAPAVTDGEGGGG